MTAEVREQIVAALRAHGPLARKPLAVHVLADSPAQLSQALYVLKQEKKIRKRADGLFALIGEEGAARGIRLPAGLPTAVRGGSGTAPSPAPAAVEAILIEAAARAQTALDEYLASVGDPNVYGPLKASRDQARLALENYRQGTGA